jgi:Fur family transcriptional regulator, ferric uptake regulator
MLRQKEERIFESYLLNKGLKHSQQRKEILDVFLSIDKHLTTDELYRIVKKRHPRIGCATVYRTLKLFSRCGLCRELKFEDGTSRYEHLYAHPHHDHIICTTCGRFIEVIDPDIERLQDKLFKLHGFHPQRHKMELYGVCQRCKPIHKI